MSPPRPDSGEDEWIWGAEPDGRFTVKSAYKILHTQPGPNIGDHWKVCWKWKGPHRIRMFLWLAIQGKLLTNQERYRRHMTLHTACGYCQDTSESVTHVLRDCAFAKEVWRIVGGFDTSGSLWQGSGSEWLCHGLNSEKCLLFAVVCWWLWRARNERTFANSTEPASAIARRIQYWVLMVGEASDRSRRNLPDTVAREMTSVAWTPGSVGWITVNSDGSFDARLGRAAAGGLARDSEGRCRFAYTMNLGSCSITRAEMRGASEGLRRAWDAGFGRVELQMDSRVAITLLNSDDRLRTQHGLEIDKFKELKNRNLEVVIKHVYREGNHAADHLAGIGYGYPFGSHSFSLSDCNFGYFLRYDCLGIAEQRSVLIND
ncbi:Putative ribonuclease H protein At1g65750 [Linum perenne]